MGLCATVVFGSFMLWWIFRAYQGWQGKRKRKGWGKRRLQFVPKKPQSLDQRPKEGPFWQCHKCGLDHHDPAAPKCRVCQTPRIESQWYAEVKKETTEKDREIQSLKDKQKASEARANGSSPAKGKGAGAETTPNSEGAPGAGSLSSLVSSDLPQPPTTIPTFTHPALKVLPVAQDKGMAKALEAASIQVEDGVIKMMPKAAAAASQVQKLEDSVQALSNLLGPEDPSTLAVKKNLEAEKQKAGTHAQLKNTKQLQDAIYQASCLSQRCEEEYQNFLKIEEKNLVTLQDSLEQQKAYMEGIKQAHQTRLQQIADMAEQLQKHKGQVESMAKEDVVMEAGVTTAATAAAAVPDPFTDFVTSAKSILQGSEQPNAAQQKDLMKSLMDLLAASPATGSEQAGSTGPVPPEKTTPARDKPY